MSEVAEILQGTELVSRFTEVAPPWMVYKAEYGFALQQLKSNDYTMKVAQNNPNSLLAAMTNVAACGLSLNPARKEAYLVPRKGGVCLDPSYMGLVKLATDTGSILWAQSKLVYENDTYQVNGVDEKPLHQTNPFGDRGKLIGVYCVAKTHDGSYLTENMSIEDVYAIRNRSEAYKSNPNKTPWATDEGEMVRKTVTKKASKMWPRSDNHDAERRLANAVQMSYDNEEVKLTTSNPQLNDYTDQQKDFYNQLISDSDALGMYIFQCTIAQGVKSNLYHSFVDGTKGKFQRIVDDLYSQGFDKFTEYLNLFAQAQESGDSDAMLELEAELTETEIEFIRSKI